MKKCPFPWCRNHRGDGQFCCKGHWIRMEKEQQDRAKALLLMLSSGKITTAECNRIKDDIIAHCPGAIGYMG